MKPHPERGQALVEAVLLLPLLVTVLLGAYASVRTAILRSRAESSAFAQALRVGRGLSELRQDLSRSISSDPGTVVTRSARGETAGILPAFVARLAGRTTATVEARKEWDEIGAPDWLPAARPFRKASLHADCWGEKTTSGSDIRRAVGALVVLGAVR